MFCHVTFDFRLMDVVTHLSFRSKVYFLQLLLCITSCASYDFGRREFVQHKSSDDTTENGNRGKEERMIYIQESSSCLKNRRLRS